MFAFTNGVGHAFQTLVFEPRFPQQKTTRITTVTASFVRSKSVVGLIFFSGRYHLFTWVGKETSGDVT